MYIVLLFLLLWSNRNHIGIFPHFVKTDDGLLAFAQRLFFTRGYLFVKYFFFFTKRCDKIYLRNYRKK